MASTWKTNMSHRLRPGPKYWKASKEVNFTISRTVSSMLPSIKPFHVHSRSQISVPPKDFNNQKMLTRTHFLNFGLPKSVCNTKENTNKKNWERKSRKRKSNWGHKNLWLRITLYCWRGIHFWFKRDQKHKRRTSYANWDTNTQHPFFSLLTKKPNFLRAFFSFFGSSLSPVWLPRKNARK